MPKLARSCWPGILRPLGRSAVFANQAAKNLAVLDPGGGVDDMAGLAHRRFLLRALVRTVPVVVPGVLGQDAAEVTLAEDQHVVPGTPLMCAQ